MPNFPQYQIPDQGLIMLIDKPYGWTSFQVVNFLKWKIKHLTKLKKFKIGHAGTLDPLATGLLVICVGKMTKQIPLFINAEKTYNGSGILGYTSTCYDLEKPLKKSDFEGTVSEGEITAKTKKFLGEIEQLPPIFSAKKIKGKKAYEIGREGKTPELNPSKVHIHTFDISRYNHPYFSFHVHCSKGTYIRSLVHDLGAQLKCGAVLTALRRIKSGEFDIKDAKKKHQWLELLQEKMLTAYH